MKYLEELESGDAFEFNNQHYLVSCDFKKNGHRSCVNLTNGQINWIEPNAIVNISPVYKLDQDNNIISIKTTEKQDA